MTVRAPRKEAVKACAGRSHSASGVADLDELAVAHHRRRGRTCASASSWSWVTNRVVMSKALLQRPGSRCASRRADAHRGSTAARRAAAPRGSITSARASATRCCWPPESWRRIAVRECDKPDHLQRRAGALAPIRCAEMPHPQPEGDVLDDRQVREQGVGLEHHADVAPVRRHAGSGPRRRSGCGRCSARRSRRPCAASSSCRSRTARAARRARPARPPA